MFNMSVCVSNVFSSSLSVLFLEADYYLKMLDLMTTTNLNIVASC